VGASGGGIWRGKGAVMGRRTSRKAPPRRERIGEGGAIFTSPGYSASSEEFVSADPRESVGAGVEVIVWRGLHGIAPSSMFWSAAMSH